MILYLFVENFSNKDHLIKSKIIKAPLICNLKRDFEGATWDFLEHELEQM